MKSTLFTHFLIFFQFVLIQGAAEVEEALIFDRFTRSLFQLPLEVPENAICEAWAVACPAETSAEKAFVEEYSFTKNGLFVGKIHDRGSSATEVKRNQCEDSYKISLTYNVRSLTFQFGFEIYYELTDAPYFHINKFEDYKSPSNIVKSLTTFWEKGKFILPEYYRMLKSSIDSDIKELWFDKNKRMGFAWIYLTKFLFDFSKKILRRMEYDIGSNSKWPASHGECTDFNLGSEFYQDLDLDKLYSQNDGSKFKMPAPIACKSNVECFHKWLLVPLDQFRFGSSTSPVCSNMVTIPIWKIAGIDFALRRVDQYLYALFRHLGEPLRVIAGISGKHKYKKRRALRKTTVYLDMNKQKIPVPEIIYKMVEYRVKNCHLEESSCWYSVTIVVHNDPLFKPNDRLCAEEFTKQWGWEKIIEDAAGNEQNFIYVCPRTKQIIKKLIGFSLGLRQVRVSVIDAELKLSEFPISSDGKTIEKSDIRANVNEKLEEFVKNGENVDREAGKILELVQRKVFNPESRELLSESETHLVDLAGANYESAGTEGSGEDVR